MDNPPLFDLCPECAKELQPLIDRHIDAMLEENKESMLAHFKRIRGMSVPELSKRLRENGALFKEIHFQETRKA